jgi:hypothetical protein
MLTDECDNTDPEPEPESEPTNVPFADGNNFLLTGLSNNYSKSSSK